MNFNKNAVDLTGKETPYNLGQILGNFLAQSSKGDSMRLWEIAQKIYKGDDIQLLAEDAKSIASMVKESELSNLLKAQVLLILNHSE